MRRHLGRNSCSAGLLFRLIYLPLECFPFSEIPSIALGKKVKINISFWKTAIRDIFPVLFGFFPFFRTFILSTTCNDDTCKDDDVHQSAQPSRVSQQASQQAPFDICYLPSSAMSYIDPSTYPRRQINCCSRSGNNLKRLSSTHYALYI